MGRSYIVDDTVEGYLSKLCDQWACPVTGLIIGQSSAQRDFVIMAAQTPRREESNAASRNGVDREWVTEHARQVSRMMPGGLSVIGVFIIDANNAKDTSVTLQHLVLAVENLISSECLWYSTDDDITDRVTLHINPKTRTAVCRTVDISNPKSMTKPADWKYQPSVCSSWSTVSCCLNVDMLVPLPADRTRSVSFIKSLKEGLKSWAHQIEMADCLISGQKLPEDAELTAGQKRNVGQAFTAQLLVTPAERLSDVIQSCGGSVSVRGAIHSTAYFHNNKPKAKLAEKVLKRDVVSTMATRVQLLLEEQLMSEESSSSSSKDADHVRLPCRIYCPAKVSMPVQVCDYHFIDEGLSEVTDRLKEMLDIDVAEGDLDTKQENHPEFIERHASAEPAVETTDVLKPKSHYLLGIFMASAVAVLATAASMLYLSEV